MNTGTGNEEGDLSALLDEEAEEEVGVHGDDLSSASCPRPTVEAQKLLPPLPSTAFKGQRSWRRKPRFRPSLSAVRDVSPVPSVPSCPPPPPLTTSVLNRLESSSDELGQVDKGKGKAVDEEQTATRPTFRQRVATAPVDTRSDLPFCSLAPPIPRLPSPLPSFVRRMTETSAPPRLADRPLHPDLFREGVPVVTASQPTPTPIVPRTRPPIPQVTPFIHSPPPKRASTASMAPTDRPVTPPQVAQPELKSRWSPSPPSSPTKVQKLVKAMSFANLRSQKSKTNLRDQPSSSSVPPVPALPLTTPITNKRSSNRLSAGTKKSTGSFGRGTSPSHKSTWMATASCLDPTFVGRDTSAFSRPRTASGRTERTSTSSTLSAALSKQASTITPERTQAEVPPLPPLPPLGSFPPVPPMSAAPQSPPRPTGPRRKISIPTMFLRKKSSVGRKEDTVEENEGADKEDN